MNNSIGIAQSNNQYIRQFNRALLNYEIFILEECQQKSRAKLPEFLALKVEGRMIKIRLATISYIQSWGNYVKIHTDDKIYLSPITTAEIEKNLDNMRFKRIHKSYIVALSRIQRITGEQAVLKNDISLPIGSTFKRILSEYFK